MFIFRKRRKKLIEQRQKYCQEFYKDVEQIFVDILTGRKPFYMDKANSMWREAKSDVQFDVSEVQTNERIPLGSFIIEDNDIGMTHEMTAYEMSRSHGTYRNAWELEYIPVEKQGYGCVDVYARYRADYRFDYSEKKGTFLVKECHSGSVVKYNLPFYATANEVAQIRRYVPEAIIDFVHATDMRVVKTSYNTAEVFTMDLYRKHRNVYLAKLVAEGIQYIPILAQDMVHNKAWFDRNYISQQEAQYIFNTAGGYNVRQIGTQNIQNTQRQSPRIR